MKPFEIIEIIDPPAEAMVRTFHCHVCDKAHLQEGEIARIWVFYQDGYSTQASMECVKKLQEQA